MQWSSTAQQLRRRALPTVAVAVAVLWWAHEWLWHAAMQVVWGGLVALAALPVMRVCQRYVSAGTAALMSLAALGAGVTAAVLLLVPPLLRQGRELAEMLPGLYATAEEMLSRMQGYLQRSGVTVGAPLQLALMQRAQHWLAGLATGAVEKLGAALGSIGRWLPVPVLGYYFLRDRRRIGQWLLSLAPVASRAIILRVCAEMRRETAGYLRGQLLVSAAVGALTAVGLLLCGVPAWLALGVLMGFLELIPYIGPLAGGAAVVLFALPGGLTRTLWALVVAVGVQQLEGALLSPRLMGDATCLHPAAVVLLITAGGLCAGVWGVLLAVPLVLCMRAVLRILSLPPVG